MNGMSEMSKNRTGRAFRIALLWIAFLALGRVLLAGRVAYGYAGSAPGPGPWPRPLEIIGVHISTDPAPTPSPDEVTRVSKEFYCPLCTGVRLDVCDLPLCDQMREVIRQKLTAGETKEEIKAYFVEQYGQEVLGVPPKRGGMILAWVLPFLVVLVAGGWVYRMARRRTRQRETEVEAAAPQPLPAEYVERLERELEQFE
ncbi:MAG: cytochrome c-type biogenesis protein CcmH [Anaerolineae bacterium]